MKKLLRSLARSLLRLWYRTGRKDGWQYRLVEAQGARCAEPAPLLTRLPNGLAVECDLTEQIPRLVYFRGVYEPIEAFLFHRLLRPGWTVVDAGANLGQYTLLAAAAVGPAGHVHAFEPVPSTAALLRRNLALNARELPANVVLNQAALWHETATLQLGLSQENAHVSGGFSVGVQPGAVPLARQIETPALTLDDYLQSRHVPRLDLIKMDIEGAEYFALLGMRRSLALHRPLLLMEVCRPYALRLGYSLDAVWKLLVEDLGYSARVMAPSASGCVALPSFAAIEQENILFHPAPLPPALFDDWNMREILRWSRQGWSRPARSAPARAAAAGLE